MSKHKRNEQITFNDLTKSEKIALSLTYEALRRDDKYISMYIKGKSIDIAVHPWGPERTGHWEKEFLETGRMPGEYTARYRCSECGRFYDNEPAYCPGCGARMEDDGK